MSPIELLVLLLVTERCVTILFWIYTQICKLPDTPIIDLWRRK